MRGGIKYALALHWCTDITSGKTKNYIVDVLTFTKTLSWNHRGFVFFVFFKKARVLKISHPVFFFLPKEKSACQCDAGLWVHMLVNILPNFSLVTDGLVTLFCIQKGITLLRIVLLAANSPRRMSCVAEKAVDWWANMMSKPWWEKVH